MQPIRLVFQKGYSYDFAKRLHWKSTRTQLNLNKTYWNIGDLIFLYRCSHVHLLHDFFKTSSRTSLYMLFYSYTHTLLSFCSLQISTVLKIELFLRYCPKVFERFAGHLFWIVPFKESFKKSVGQNIERRE